MSKHPVVEDLVIVPTGQRKKNWLDADSHCVSLAWWIESLDYQDKIKFNPITKRQIVMTDAILRQTGLIVPYIDVEGEGALLTYNNDSNTQPWILYVSVQPGRSMRYQITKRPVVNGDHDWKFITDKDTAASILFELGHYVTGTPNLSRIA